MITAMRHAALGVADAERSRAFYRDFLFFRSVLSDHSGYLEELKHIIGALVEVRSVVVASKEGGGALMFVEHLSTRPAAPAQPVRWGDLGYLELGLEAYRLEELYLDLRKKGLSFLTPVRCLELSSGGMERYAYLRDPDGLLVQLVEVGEGERPAVGGVRHVAVGVADMDEACRVCRGALGFGEIIHEFKGRLPELDEVTGGGEMEMLILGSESAGPGDGPAGKGPAIKLVRTLDYKGRDILEGRRWGDIGLTEIALETDDFEETVNRLISLGVELLLPPRGSRQEDPSSRTSAYLAWPVGGFLKLGKEEGRRVPAAVARQAHLLLRRLKGKENAGGSSSV